MPSYEVGLCSDCCPERRTCTADCDPGPGCDIRLTWPNQLIVEVPDLSGNCNDCDNLEGSVLLQWQDATGWSSGLAECDTNNAMFYTCGDYFGRTGTSINWPTSSAAFVSGACDSTTCSGFGVATYSWWGAAVSFLTPPTALSCTVGISINFALLTDNGGGSYAEFRDTWSGQETLSLTCDSAFSIVDWINTNSPYTGITTTTGARCSTTNPPPDLSVSAS